MRIGSRNRMDVEDWVDLQFKTGSDFVIRDDLIFKFLVIRENKKIALFYRLKMGQSLEINSSFSQESFGSNYQ